jgi:hypothetical protein
MRWREHPRGKVFYDHRECLQDSEDEFCLSLFAIGRPKLINYPTYNSEPFFII